MIQKVTTLVLDNEVVQNLKKKGFIISKVVREFLKLVDKKTDSFVNDKSKK